MKKNLRKKVLLFVLSMAILFTGIKLSKNLSPNLKTKVNAATEEAEIDENTNELSVEEKDTEEASTEEENAQEADEEEIAARETEISTAAEESDEETDTIPVYDEDTKSTVYSCIYFGTYPQTEVTKDSLISALEAASYDENGDTQIDGEKYHKIEKASGNSYFLYEPIKWKIIANVRGNIVAMAERGLDYCSYYEAQESSEPAVDAVEELTDEELEEYSENKIAYTDVSWDNSTIRSWLNSYGKKKNLAKKSYKKYGAGFLSTAFSKAEKKDLAEAEDFTGSRLENYVTALSGDRIFLLNLAGATHAKYGFLESNAACPGRILEQTDYAAARREELSDEYSAENAWWLSSGLEDTLQIQYINKNGKIKKGGTSSYYALLARPVIVIKGNSSNIKDAGKEAVSNEGGVSISVDLQADNEVSLDDVNTRYKDATISIVIKNIGEEMISALDATLEFGDGTDIVDGKNSVHFANIEAGDKKNITWKLAIKPQKEEKNETYTIQIIGDGLGETVLKQEIQIPKLEKTTADLEKEIEEEEENRSWLEKLRDFLKSLT